MNRGSFRWSDKNMFRSKTDAPGGSGETGKRMQKDALIERIDPFISLLRSLEGADYIWLLPICAVDFIFLGRALMVYWCSNAATWWNNYCQTWTLMIPLPSLEGFRLEQSMSNRTHHSNSFFINQSGQLTISLAAKYEMRAAAALPWILSWHFCARTYARRIFWASVCEWQPSAHIFCLL